MLICEDVSPKCAEAADGMTKSKLVFELPPIQDAGLSGVGFGQGLGLIYREYPGVGKIRTGVPGGDNQDFQVLSPNTRLKHSASLAVRFRLSKERI